MNLTDLTGTHSKVYVKMILDAGYKVYMRKPNDQHWFSNKGYSNSVKKYRDWKHYHNASKWNNSLNEVKE